MSEKTPKIIDAWCNAFSAASVQAMPEIKRLFLQSGSLSLLEFMEKNPDYKLTGETLLSMMDAGGI